MTASIKSALQAAVEASQSRTTAPSDHFRMSSLGKCPRAQIGARAGLPPTNPWPTRTYFKLWIGSLIHREVQYALLKEGFFDEGWPGIDANGKIVEPEVVYRSYVGHPDGRTSRLPSGKAIVELKTSDDNAITRYDWPEHYLWQGFAYCLATGLSQLLLFQLGTNQGLSRENVFYLRPDWAARINSHITAMEMAWVQYQETSVLPPHVHTFGWENKTCNYLEQEAP